MKVKHKIADKTALRNQNPDIKHSVYDTSS